MYVSVTEYFHMQHSYIQRYMWPVCRLYIPVSVCMIMYVHVYGRICMYLYVRCSWHWDNKKNLLPQGLGSSAQNWSPKTQWHIHTHTCPWQSVSGGGFAMLLRTLATPMLSATYPGQLGRGSWWARQVPMARGGPMGRAGGLLSPLPTRAARTGAPNRVWEWVPDRWIKWRSCCPGLSWVGSAGCRPAGGCFGPVVTAFALAWASTYNTGSIHAHTIHTRHAHMDWNQYIHM